tara:strand:- start:411 stop:1772 length:1362 start_codon:yes stop_codon:yes gene_type:complete
MKSILNMKKVSFLLLAISMTFVACEDFLDESPPIGLTDDKLTDIPSMKALVNGAYDKMRGFYAYQPMITSGFVRDYVVRSSANWAPYYKWTVSGVPQMFSGNSYNNGMRALNAINTVLTANVDAMYGTQAEKSKILGDAHFLRAAIYFQLNMYYTLPSSGNSIPLITTVLGTNDRVSVATSAAIKAQVESDIEKAREYFKVANGVSTHTAATAMASRIYFFHEKYNLAYDRANEAITSGSNTLEVNVADIYTKGAASTEAIYTIITNRTENTFGPQSIGNTNFQADKDKGVASLNPNSLIAQFRNAEPNDKRFKDLFTSKDGLVYIDKKYPSLDSDYIVLRLPEMYLTRAEASIMVSGSVSAAAISDVNMVRSRAGVTSISGTPTTADMLEMIYKERSKELCFEYGDRFLNTRRLKKDIVAENGNGIISHSTYNELLVYPIPQSEVDIHNLKR